jgi:hypothetical protein
MNNLLMYLMGYSQPTSSPSAIISREYSEWKLG